MLLKWCLAQQGALCFLKFYALLKSGFLYTSLHFVFTTEQKISIRKHCLPRPTLKTKRHLLQPLFIWLIVCFYKSTQTTLVLLFVEHVKTEFVAETYLHLTCFSSVRARFWNYSRKMGAERGPCRLAVTFGF